MSDLSRRIVVCGLSSFSVLSILAVALLGSMPAMAALGPKIVQGYVYDNEGNVLEGALVTVEVVAQGTGSVRDTRTETSGSDGYYMVTFANDKWDIGDTIRAMATYDSVQSQVNETTATASANQDLDIHFTTAIPQFGSALGFGVGAVFVCAVGLALVSRRRKQ